MLPRNTVWIGPVVAFLLLPSCDSLTPAPELSKSTRELRLGQWLPRMSEREAIGAVDVPVTRATPLFFRALFQSRSTDIVFKDEEATGADRWMTRRLEQRLERLNRLVEAEWDGLRLRVTEAWDENLEHGPQSAHYEGRAADLTTSDVDADKLGRLGFLAVQAGFDWVYFENASHIHASVRK